MTSRIKLESFSTSRSRKQARKVFDEEIVPDHVATVLAIAQTQNDAVTVRSLLLSVSMADGFEDKVGGRGTQLEQDALEVVLGQHLRQPFVHDLPTGGGHMGGGRKAVGRHPYLSHRVSQSETGNATNRMHRPPHMHASSYGNATNRSPAHRHCKSRTGPSSQQLQLLNHCLFFICCVRLLLTLCGLL